MGSGGSDNGPPGLRLDYHPNYYAAFVLDPEGNNIEVVCHAPEGVKAAPRKMAAKKSAKPAKKAAARSRPRRRSKGRVRRSQREEGGQGSEDDQDREAAKKRQARRARGQTTFSGTCAGGTMSLRHESDGSAQRAGNAKSVSALYLAHRLVDRRCARARRLLRRSRRSLRAAAPPRGSRSRRADAAALRRRRRRERGARATAHVRRALRRAAAHLRDGAPAGGRNRAGVVGCGAREPRRPPIWRWVRATSIEGCLTAIACSAPASGSARSRPTCRSSGSTTSPSTPRSDSCWRCSCRRRKRARRTRPCVTRSCSIRSRAASATRS